MTDPLLPMKLWSPDIDLDITLIVLATVISLAVLNRISCQISQSTITLLPALLTWFLPHVISLLVVLLEQSSGSRVASRSQ